jgi:hypothetical protein
MLVIGLEDVVEWILWQYTHLYACYVADRELIEKSRLVEIAFHDLEKSPTDEVRRVYETFGCETKPYTLIPKPHNKS